MRNTRKWIAVTLLATALCADRMALATPAQPPIVQLAGRLIHRLSNGFRQALPSARLAQPTRLAGGATALRVMPRPVCPAVVSVQLSPFQFRLPPPVS